MFVPPGAETRLEEKYDLVEYVALGIPNSNSELTQEWTEAKKSARRPIPRTPKPTASPSAAGGHSMASAMACKGHGRAQACCWHRQTSHAHAGGPTTLRRRCRREAQINSVSFCGLMRGLHSSSWHCPHYSNAIPDCFSSQGQTRGVRTGGAERMLAIRLGKPPAGNP